MQFKFRNFVLAPVLMAAAMATTAMAEVTLKVPFNFTVNGKTLPAGTYAVQPDAKRTFVTLRSKESSKSFTWLMGPGDPLPNDGRVVIKFDEANGTHILRSVQFGSAITSRLDKSPMDSERRNSRAAGGE